MGKGKPGIQAGEYGDFGNYDQCLAIAVESNDKSNFVGQYCLAKLHLPLPHRGSEPDVINLTSTKMSGTWAERHVSNYKFMYAQSPVLGICFPSTCQSSEIQTLIQNCKALLFHQLQ